MAARIQALEATVELLVARGGRGSAGRGLSDSFGLVAETRDTVLSAVDRVSGEDCSWPARSAHLLRCSPDDGLSCLEGVGSPQQWLGCPSCLSLAASGSVAYATVAVPTYISQ